MNEIVKVNTQQKVANLYFWAENSFAPGHDSFLNTTHRNDQFFNGKYVAANFYLFCNETTEGGIEENRTRAMLFILLLTCLIYKK